MVVCVGMRMPVLGTVGPAVDVIVSVAVAAPGDGGSPASAERSPATEPRCHHPEPDRHDHGSRGDTQPRVELLGHDVLRSGDSVDVGDEQVLALAFGEDGVWVAKSDDPGADEIDIVRIDPSSVAVDDTSTTVKAGVPVRIAAGEGGVWTTLIGGPVPSAADEPSGVAVVDPTTGDLVTTVDVGERPSGIATGAGAVWVANAGDGTVTRIEPGG